MTQPPPPHGRTIAMELKVKTWPKPQPHKNLPPEVITHFRGRPSKV